MVNDNKLFEKLLHKPINDLFSKVPIDGRLHITDRRSYYSAIDYINHSKCIQQTTRESNQYRSVCVAKLEVFFEKSKSWHNILDVVSLGCCAFNQWHSCLDRYVSFNAPDLSLIPTICSVWLRISAGPKAKTPYTIL